MRGNPHVRFGGRAEETDRLKGRHRAPARPNHTCAALLINADPPAHPLAVMKRLGHSSITVTYNTYGHLFPALDEALTSSVDRAYRAALTSQLRSPLPVTSITSGSSAVPVE